MTKYLLSILFWLCGLVAIAHGADTKLTALSQGTCAALYYGEQGGISKKYNGCLVYNVDDFGADPTGVADSAAAVNALIAAAPNNIGAIQFGPGTYKFTSAVNLERGQSSFVIRGAASTVINCNFADFCFRRVYENPGSVQYVRSFEDIQVRNTNLSSGSTISISSISWSSTNGGEIAVGLASPHGITVGDTRLINITGVTGVTTYNQIWGAQATSTTALKIAYTNGSLSSGTGGSFNIMPGGAIALAGSLRGSASNVLTEGYYSFYSAQSATISLYNMSVLCAGGNRTSGTIGIYFGGETAIHDVDVTFCDTGLQSWAPSTTAFVIEGSRVENNNTGAAIFGGTAGKVHGTSFESNQGDAIYVYGSSNLHFDALAIIGSVSSVNGIHIAGATQFATFSNIVISGTFSGAAITVDGSINVQGTRFSGVNAINNGGGTQTNIALLGIQIESSNFNSTYTVATRPLSASGSPPLEGDVLRFSDVSTTDAVWGGVVGANSTGSNHRIARYSIGSNIWIVIGQY